MLTFNNFVMIMTRFKAWIFLLGIVMTGNEMSQIIFSLVLSYYGGKGHRPRWIATGVLFSAMSCFVLASPHFIFGSGNDALSLTQEYSHLSLDGSSHSFGTNGSSIFGENLHFKIERLVKVIILHQTFLSLS